MYTTITPTLTDRQFREAAADFYIRLKNALTNAGVRCRGGKTTLSWRGGCVDLIDRSGEKCHPYRVRVMWNYPPSSWVGAYEHVLEMGAPDEQSLLGMVPVLVAFLLGERSEMWMFALYHPRGRPVDPIARSIALVPFFRRIVPLR
jgi:hypothetical protein